MDSNATHERDSPLTPTLGSLDDFEGFIDATITIEACDVVNLMSLAAATAGARSASLYVADYGLTWLQRSVPMVLTAMLCHSRPHRPAEPSSTRDPSSTPTIPERCGCRWPTGPTVPAFSKSLPTRPPEPSSEGSNVCPGSLASS